MRAGPDGQAQANPASLFNDCASAKVPCARLATRKPPETLSRVRRSAPGAWPKSLSYVLMSVAAEAVANRLADRLSSTLRAPAPHTHGPRAALKAPVPRAAGPLTPSARPASNQSTAAVTWPQLFRHISVTSVGRAIC
jgi:hypothetical protein